MQAPGMPSVDQLLVLLTVVEEGSFTGAAKRLRRATSAISYAIDTLEAQLGLTPFDRGTTRRPKLTHVGEVRPTLSTSRAEGSLIRNHATYSAGRNTSVNIVATARPPIME